MGSGGKIMDYDYDCLLTGEEVEVKEGRINGFDGKYYYQEDYT